MSFKPPDNFDFSRPAVGPTWRQRFLRYRTASKLATDSFEAQISALIYAMGEDAENIYSTFTIHRKRNPDADPPDTTFDDVVELFNRHFMPKVNVIHERAIFHQRVQGAGENIETFVRGLYDLAEHADFTDKDSSIRDRLAAGLRDKELSEKLQMHPDLTLQQAITLHANMNE